MRLTKTDATHRLMQEKTRAKTLPKADDVCVRVEYQLKQSFLIKTAQIKFCVTADTNIKTLQIHIQSARKREKNNIFNRFCSYGAWKHHITVSFEFQKCIEHNKPQK